MVTRSAPDYYELLRIPPNAGDSQIKRAYRRAAVRWHPDVNPSPEAGEMMKHVNEARRVLLDPFLRREYDRTSEIYLAWKRQRRQKQKSRPVPGPTVKSRERTTRHRTPGVFRAVATVIWLIMMVSVIFGGRLWILSEAGREPDASQPTRFTTEPFFQPPPITTGNTGLDQTIGRFGTAGWSQPNDPFQKTSQSQPSVPFAGSTSGHSGVSGFGGGGSFGNGSFAGSFP